MAGWIAKKMQNSRVLMCIKEVKWELEAGDKMHRATILALTHFLREGMFDEDGFPEDMLDRPLDYSRDDLFQIYEGMENIRNGNTLQIEQTKKNMKNFGMNLPEFSIQHAKNMNKAIEVLMCTIGAGLTTDRRDDVRDIWKYLSGSREHIKQAIMGIKEFEVKTAEATGVPSEGMFANRPIEEWVVACEFVPSIFVKELEF